MPKTLPDLKYLTTKWMFDRERLGRLTDAYERAVAEGDDQFTFDGVQLLTGYAKYLIEYLDYRLD